MVAWAYQFVCDKSFEEMEAILNARGPWTWGIGDSSWWGDYLKCRPEVGALARIHDPESHIVRASLVAQPRLAGDVRRYISQLEAESDTQRTALDAVFLELLSRLGARDIVAIDTYW